MRKYIFIILGAALAASCTLFTGQQNAPTRSTSTLPSATDISTFQKSFMSSYYAERDGAPMGVAGGARALTPFNGRRASGAKATVPLGSAQVPTYSWQSLRDTTTTISGDYPEPLQKTTFLVTLFPTQVTSIKWADARGTASGNWNVYDVTATTTFPANDIRSNYVEEYYVADCGSGVANDLGTWTANDPIVTLNGAAAIQNQDARIKMVLTFLDGSTRNETIVSSSLSGGQLLDSTAFYVNGSLDLSQAFVPTTATSATYPGFGVQYSSIVMYYVTPKTTYNYWFWQGSNQQTILGIRYYTEVASPGGYTAYTASFEKTISTLTTTGGGFTSTLQTVFSGSQFTTLAETVLRQQVVYGLTTTINGSSTYYVADTTQPGSPTTNMETRVVNVAGQQDFILAQINTDYATLSSANSTKYVPTGSATEILASNPSANVFVRNQQIIPAPGTLPFAVSTSEKAALGDLGTLYGSITDGTAVGSTVANAPASNVLPLANTEYAFNGQQVIGTQINPASIPALTTSGTVEAWLWINTMTDTMGIIHKGVKVDFTDEAYSLQGWGAGGQIAMIVDRSGTYDAAYSDINLNTGKWYYIVGTWDVTGSNRYLRLYINGVLHGSASPSVIYNAGTTDNQSLGMMVGSQIPSSYNSTWGYFGVNGKILGVNVSKAPMTPAAIAAKYAATNTTGW